MVAQRAHLRRGKSSAVLGSSTSTGAGPPRDSKLPPLDARVAGRLRDTFGNMSHEERDVLVSAEGLTLRETLARYLRLADAGADDAPDFGLYYNNRLRETFRKKGTSRDLIKMNEGETGVVSPELMEVSGV